MKRLVLLVVLAGCGALPPVGGQGGGSAAGGGGGGSTLTEVEALSGTRLKNRYLLGEDGSRAPLGFFDTTRNEPCVFTWADDGKQRCLPIGLEGLAGRVNLYFDSGCTESLAISKTGCAALKYVLENTADQCVLGSSIRSITQLTPGTAFYGGTPSSCSMSTVSTGDDYRYYRIGPKIPASSFVAAEIKVEP